MLTRLALLATVGVALFVGTGCAGKTADQRDTLVQQNKALSDQLEAERKARADAEERARLASSQTPAAPDMAAPTEAGTGPIASGGTPSRSADLGEGITRGKTKHGQDVIQISGEVLFASGKAALKPSAMKSLDKVAAIIKKEYAGQQLRVEGHTDSNPVRKSGWDDNWDLGAARARAVLLYLAKKGVPEKQMYIASFAANEPKSTKNMALDRRVEIVVTNSGR